MDPRLGETYDATQQKRLGFAASLCIRASSTWRPTMSEVAICIFKMTLTQCHFFFPQKIFINWRIKMIITMNLLIRWIIASCLIVCRVHDSNKLPLVDRPRDRFSESQDSSFCYLNRLDMKAECKLSPFPFFDCFRVDDFAHPFQQLEDFNM